MDLQATLSQSNPAPVLAGAENLFDPSRLRLSQDFGKKAGVKDVVPTIPVRKPDRQEFIRVHPDENMRVETEVIELKEDGETYLVDPALWTELAAEVVPKVLFTTVNRQGVLTVWPVRLPGPDGRLDPWNRSALEAAQMAMKAWVRVVSNKSRRAYDIREAIGNYSDPEWPELSFQQILSTAFKDKYIQDLNHPAIRRLRGES